MPQPILWKPSLLLALTTAITIAPGWAQDTDAAETIKSILKGIGPFPVTRIVGVPRRQTVCDGRNVNANRSQGEPPPDHPRRHCEEKTVIVNEPRTTQEVLTASNIKIIANDPIAFDAITETGLPNKLFVAGSAFTNCSSQAVTQQISLQVAFQRSASTQISQSVTSSLGYSVGLKWTVVPGVDLSGSLTIGQSSTHGTVDTNGWQETVTRAGQTQASLAPKTALYAQIATWPIVYTPPFHTIVRVDADVSSNDKAYHKLSDFVDSSKLTFPLKGIITFTDASGGQITVYDQQFDPSVCKPGGGVVVSPVKAVPGKLKVVITERTSN